MKNLKHLETRDYKHFYQIDKSIVSVDSIIASLYSGEQSGDTAICWFIKSAEVTAPIELWKDIKGIDTWQALLSWRFYPEIELLINPVTGGQSYNEHPIIKNLKGIARSWGRTVPNGKVADTLNLFALQASLEYLEFQNQIDWNLYSTAGKAKELIKRGDIGRSEVAALAQGIIYLSGQLPEEDFVPGSLASVRRSRNRPNGRRGQGRSVTVNGRRYQQSRRIR